MTDTAPHHWRFFRSGGFDQLRIETVSDLRALPQLDLKLWATLACPTTGLAFDARTLGYIDTDHDQRIRAPEILAAVEWALAHLSEPQCLFAAPGLPLSAINIQVEDGAHLLSSARRMLHNLGKADATHLYTSDTDDLTALFPTGQFNGDGLVSISLASDDALRDLITDITTHYECPNDRCGEPGISAEQLATFLEHAQALTAWRARAIVEAEHVMPLGEATAQAIDAYHAVAGKIDDFFMRAQFAAYDARAAALMNGTEAELTDLASQILSHQTEQALKMPLAQVRIEATLPLSSGINPAWITPMRAFAQAVVTPLLGARESLTQDDWLKLKARLQAHLDWQASKPQTPLDNLDSARLQGYLDRQDGARLQALIEQDTQIAAEADGVLAVDKLIRFQHFLLTLLNNFVSLRAFYSQRDGIFQSGRLYLDGRSFDLCLPVENADKHAALAEQSYTYLAYCDCSHAASGRKRTIVVAATAGSAGHLIVGRNGIFYDRQGQDWDATISKVVANPISLRDAFWMPYRRIGKLISDQIQKLAASKEAALEAQASEKMAAPTASAAFDIGKFAGVFAAIGLALGAMGSAFALMISGIMAMPWWKLPLIVVAIVLLISGPSVVLAWFKLRARSLAPILDANGWAVNTEARINIGFGTALTRLAALPKGSERALKDPYVKTNYIPWLTALLLITALFALAWYQGWFDRQTLADWLAPAAAETTSTATGADATTASQP